MSNGPCILIQVAGAIGLGGLIIALASCSAPAAQSLESRATHSDQEPASAATAALANFTEVVPGSEYRFEMIAIPHGTLPGSDETIGPFWISKTEVPWELFDVFVYERDKEAVGGVAEPEIDAISRPSKPYVPPDRGFGHDGYPAISIRFKAAQAFCEWLSARTGRAYRLPNEDEWMYACLAGAEPIPADQLGEYAWFTDNSDWKTQPVGGKKPNEFGLYDMLGNAAEWYISNEDPAAGVLAGGHYDSPAEEVSHLARMKYDPSWQMMDPQVPKSPWWLSDGPFAGFRIICVPKKNETTDGHR